MQTGSSEVGADFAREGAGLLALVARHADRAVLLNRRMLASGTPEAVFSSTDFKTLFPGYNMLLSPAKEEQ